MSGLKFKRTSTDKLSVKGKLSDDGTIIQYEDDSKIMQEISLEDLMRLFAGCYVEFSIMQKEETNLGFNE